jgi:alpha-tubulin suppressor-like RCC1 family protein
VGVGTLALLVCSEFAFAQRAGTVVSWGQQVLPLVPPGTRFQAIAAGWGHSLALRSDGTVVGWGRNNFGQASPPAGLSNVVAIAAGSQHSLALLSDGTVVGRESRRSGMGCSYKPTNITVSTRQGV